MEVVGDSANIVVDNVIRVTYYRPAAMSEYGRSATYLVPDDVAPLFWEPEFSYRQLHNKNIFYSGYVCEVLHLCEAALTVEPPDQGHPGERPSHHHPLRCIPKHAARGVHQPA